MNEILEILTLFGIGAGFGIVVGLFLKWRKFKDKRDRDKLYPKNK